MHEIFKAGLGRSAEAISTCPANAREDWDYQPQVQAEHRGPERAEMLGHLQSIALASGIVDLLRRHSSHCAEGPMGDG